MASVQTRQLLRSLGLLETARAVKRKFTHVENGFAPCTPHLLIAVNRALRWCSENGTASGEYLEFGIFRGFTLWYTQALATDLGLRDLRFFGFDSFFGLPPMTGIDRGAEFHEGDYYSPRQDVEEFLNRNQVDWTRTKLVPGWFKDSLTPATRTQLGLRRCAIAVVDCDTYESTVPVLAFLEPLIVDRTVVLFDDWHNYADDPRRGEQRAFAEFLQANPTLSAEPFVDFGGHGKGFIVTRRGS